MNLQLAGRRRLPLALGCVAAIALIAAASAFAHARISPPVSLAKTRASSTASPSRPRRRARPRRRSCSPCPQGFSIDSFVPSPGWQRVLQQTGSGESAVIQKVTWTGGSVPTGEDSLFQFLAQPSSSGTYTFAVEQTYSDGSIVDWSGSGVVRRLPRRRSRSKSSLGGGGTLAR